MKETAEMAVHSDLVELFERASRAREEAVRLLNDRRFIVTWYRMRPRLSARPSLMLDGEED